MAELDIIQSQLVCRMHHDQYQVHWVTRIGAATLLQSKRIWKILAAELDTHICVTAHHVKFLCIESEGGPLSSHSCDCALDATTSGIKGSHTPVFGLVHSVLSLQHEICILQVTTGRCGNLATRLRVGQFCSTIQLSPLSGWPR